MKKLVFLLLTFMFVFSFAGCGISSDIDDAFNEFSKELDKANSELDDAFSDLESGLSDIESNFNDIESDIDDIYSDIDNSDSSFDAPVIAPANTYEEIYNEYTGKLESTAEELVAEFYEEAVGLEIDAIAELYYEKVEKLAEIEFEGTEEMAELYSFLFDYDEYMSWTGKLYDVYMEKCEILTDAYMEISVG